jgi:hypothetical protein
MGDSPSRRLDGVPDLESESGGGLPTSLDSGSLGVKRRNALYPAKLAAALSSSSE